MISIGWVIELLIHPMESYELGRFTLPETRLFPLPIKKILRFIPEHK